MRLIVLAILAAGLLVFLALASLPAAEYAGEETAVETPEDAPEINLVLYYGTGCPHCERAQQTLEELRAEYNINIVKKEVYYDPVNYQEMRDAYARFGFDSGQGGVPTMIIGDRSMIIGAVTKERFREIFDEQIANENLSGVYTQYSFKRATD